MYNINNNLIKNYMEFIIVIGAFIGLLGISAYVKNTIKGNTKPNRVTWLLWSVAPLIATFASLSDGVTWGVLPTFMSGFGPLLVFISSFINKKSYWKLTKLDYFCGALSVFALILWLVTNEPNLAIILAILSDGLAALPTIIKSYKDPFSETITPYLIGGIYNTTAFLFVKNWEFTEFGFSSYIILVNIVIVSTIVFRRRALRNTIIS